jgi:hypothetical protein
MKLGLILLFGMLLQASAVEPVAEEYQVKGAFLLNFAKFVEWPASAFKGSEDAISICVFGANPFPPALTAAARQVAVNGRKVIVRQIADVRLASECHMSFISNAERKGTRTLLRAVQGESVLTVGEFQGFIAEGGVIELRVEDGSVRMDISAEAARKAGLHISARLLSLAKEHKR